MLSAQYTVDWLKDFGGSRRDKGKCVVQTFDGNMLIAGNVAKRHPHAWLIMLDDKGKEKWAKLYENNYTMNLESIIQTSDSNFIMCGEYSKSRRRSNKDGFVMKINKYGKPLWRKIYKKKGEECFNDIVEVKDNGFMLVGYSDDNEIEQKGMWFVHIDENGKKLSESLNVEYDKDIPNSIIQTGEEDFVVAGYSMSDQQKVMRITKIDIDCQILWDYPYDDRFFREAHDLVMFDDYTIMVAGTNKMKNVTDFDVLLMKLNSHGETIWTKTYGFGQWEEATSITKTFDGNIAIAGFSKPQGEEASNIMVKKLDTAGTILWQDVHKTGSIDFANSIQETKDNGLIVLGSTKGLGDQWNFAALKYRDFYSTDIHFLDSENDTTVSLQQTYTTDVCVRTYANPQNIDIIVNGILQVHDANNEYLISDSGCKFPINVNLKLQEGINTIKVIVTDLRGYIVTREKRVYYIPADDLNW